jgi:glycosyltransferase involved in cell wall biosynthesis
VLPSVEENLPMTIIEAMAAGVPVAASNRGGIPDLIQDRETGLLFKPENLRSISESVRELLTSSIGQSVAQKARAQATKRFTPDAVAAAHVAIYQKLHNSFRTAGSEMIPEVGV